MESFNEEKQKIQQSIYLEFFSLPWIVRLRFPKSNFEADHQHLLDRKVFYVDMLDILHRVPSATCSLRFCFPSPTLPMPSVHHSVPRFSARMVYRDYESMEEQSVFEKDPSKQDTSTQSPLPQEKMSGLPWYGGYCFISACNLGCRWLQVWTKTWNSRLFPRMPRLRFRIFSFFRLYLTLCWFAKYLVLFISFHGVYLPFPKKNSLC